MSTAFRSMGDGNPIDKYPFKKLHPSSNRTPSNEKPMMWSGTVSQPT